MDIQTVSSNLSNAVNPYEQSTTTKTEEKNKRSDSVQLGGGSTSSVSAYNQNSATTEVTQEEETEKSALVLKHQIQKEIWNQAYTLLKSYSEGSNSSSLLDDALAKFVEDGADPDDPIGLNAYYAANPADWEKVQNGEIPDYFNVENTASRIMKIWIGDGPTENTSAETLESIKDYIGQAYDEVAKMVGGLPQLVQDTRAYIENQLDQWIEAAQSQSSDQSDITTTLV